MLHTLGLLDYVGDATYFGAAIYLGDDRYLLHTTAAAPNHTCLPTFIHLFIERCVPAQMKAIFQMLSLTHDCQSCRRIFANSFVIVCYRRVCA